MAFAQSDSAAPRIIGVTPDPQITIVDNIGLASCTVQFSETVVIPSGAVKVWGQAGGPVTGFQLSQNVATSTLQITFTPPIVQDRATIVLDYAIADLAGNALDGEVVNPAKPYFPSGNGVPGGQAVFQISVLKGDANYDGIVDGQDAQLVLPALGSCAGDGAFNAAADLNADGCVNAVDVNILQSGQGQSLPPVDPVAATVTAILPDPAQPVEADISVVSVSFSEPLANPQPGAPAGLDPRSLSLVGADGVVHSASSAVVASDATSVAFFFQPALDRCGMYTMALSNALVDSGGAHIAPLLMPVLFSGAIAPPAPTVSLPPRITIDSTVELSGLALGAQTVRSVTLVGTLESPVAPDGAFSLKTALKPNWNNNVYVTALACGGVASVPTVVQVVQDSDPPSLQIQFPTDGAVLTQPTVDVAGFVADALSGFAGLTVSVNGAAAEVDIGIGTNGTFFLPGLALDEGRPTTITAIATDSVGNVRVREISVTYMPPPPGSPTLSLLGGNGQVGAVGTELSQPISVQVLTGDRVPFVGKLLTFTVTRSNGMLSSVSGGEGAVSVTVPADAAGQATLWWRLGGDAGCGNNRVEVTSTGIPGALVLCASATPGPAAQINVGNGNSQRIETNGPAPLPLLAWVSDSCNGIAGVPVTFTVVSGDGFVDGAPTATIETGPTGHASAQFVAGEEPGTTIIEADFKGNSGLPASFTIESVKRVPAAPTTFAGLILDNASCPIGGAECVVLVNNEAVGSAISDAQGQFSVTLTTDAGGAGELFVHGETATMLAGKTIPAGTFPGLHYERTIVPNVENRLSMPILLPRLVPQNARAWDGSTDIELTCEGIAGLRFRVKAGSMTLLDGSRPSPQHPATLSVNQVHHDDVPMPMPNGAAPPFAWTFQPGGATFDPPVEVVYPNMTGLPPGAAAYFLSFNHATGMFEIVAPGRVSADGSEIISDPGTGLSVAGWGCNCPPYAVTGNCWGPCTGPTAPGASNGCSSVPNSFKVKADGCSGTAEFSNGVDKACDIHDKGYSTCDKPKDETDTEFKANLLAECGAVFGAPGAEKCLKKCESRANTYYKGVKKFGDSFVSGYAYSSAQKHAKCCNCPVGLPVIGGGDEGEPFEELDSDDDLMPDEWESEVGLSPNDPTDAAADPDGDGLMNLWEFIADTSPFLADSDGDGVPDLESLEAIQPTFPPTLDSSWTVIVNGQLAIPEASGGFNVTNVSAPDQFGPDGPGTPPDFKSDDFYQILAWRTTGGATTYAFGEQFRITQGQTQTLGGVVFTESPPSLPESISISSPLAIISPGEEVQLTTTGVLADGSSADLTGQAQWTTYRTSNAAIATVSKDGLVTAHALGKVFITAVNNGATAVHAISVAYGLGVTTVQGIVVDGSNVPIAGAMVLAEFGGQGLTDADGSFSFGLTVPAGIESIWVLASKQVGASLLVGSSADAVVSRGGMTDVGVIMLVPAKTWKTDSSGSWSVGSNWSDGVVPGPRDVVVIDRGAASPTVTVNGGSQSCAKLICAETLTIGSGSLTLGAIGDSVFTHAVNLSGGTLTVNGAAAIGGLLTHSGGALVGSGTVSVTGGLDWTGGTTSGSGQTVIESGGTLTRSGGTVTLSRALVVRGTATWTSGTIQLNNGSLLNDGTFSVPVASGTLQCLGSGGRNVVASSGSFVKSGAGTLQFNASPAAVPFNNLGVVNVQQGTLSLASGGAHAGAFEVGSGATLNWSASHALQGDVPIVNNAGTMNFMATVTGTGSTLTMSGPGAWNLAGGKFIGGTLTELGGALLSMSSSTANSMSDVTVNGDLALTAPSAALRIAGNMVFNGVVHLGGSDARLMSETGAATTISAGTIAFEGLTGLDRHLGFVGGPGLHSLTLGPATAVRGGRGTIGMRLISSSGTTTLVKQGTLDADIAGQGLTVSNELASFANGGVSQVSNGSSLSINASAWTCEGPIENDGGTVTLAGSITNVDSTLLLSGPGTWNYSGAEVIGGTVTAMNGAVLSLSDSALNRMSNVTVNGDLLLAVPSASLRVAGSMAFNGTVRLSASDARLVSEAGAATTIASGLILFEGVTGFDRHIGFAGGAGSHSLTLGPSTVVRGGRGAVGMRLLSATGTTTLVNQGTIESDEAGQTVTVWSDLTAFANAGVAKASGGATLAINAPSWTCPGVITNDAGTVTLAGTVANSDTTMTLAGPGTWHLAGGKIVGGTLTQQDGAILSISSDSTNALSNVTVNGDLSLAASAASLRIGGAIAFDGTVHLSGSDARLMAEPGSTTISLGTIAFEGTSGFDRHLGFVGGSGSHSLTLGPLTTVQGGRGVVGLRLLSPSGTTTVVNQGTIDSNVAGQSLTMWGELSSFVNSGTSRVSGGSTLAVGTPSWSNSGLIEVLAGGVLSSPTFSQSAAGKTTCELAGTAAVNYGRLVVTGAATLSGALAVDLADPFVPPVGSTFDVMTYGTHSGQFANYDGFEVAPGVVLQPSYLPTKLQLQAVAGRLAAR